MHSIVSVRLLMAIASTFAASAALAQPFDSGSDGSYGAINVPAGQTVTLDLPPDGIIKATTVTVAVGATLQFNRNALNTPVFLLAMGAVTVDSGGKIDVSGGDRAGTVGGKGGPGGFDGGSGGFDMTPAGAGRGPGGGLAGTCGGVAGAGVGAYRTTPGFSSAGFDGQPYGSPSLIPIVGGSGGGGCLTGTSGSGGGGGGGAILVASNTLITVNGSIFSQGGRGSPGSGGAIRLVAPDVRGDGLLNVYGGPAGALANTTGGGRIRIDAIHHDLLTAAFQPPAAVTIGTALFVFPPNAPRLDIISAAGQVIAEGSGPVQVMLPFGAPANQTVTVQARNFTGTVPIAVAVLPSSGDRTVVNGAIDMSTGDPAQTTVNVTIPANTVTEIQAWTR